MTGRIGQPFALFAPPSPIPASEEIGRPGGRYDFGSHLRRHRSRQAETPIAAVDPPPAAGRSELLGSANLQAVGAGLPVAGRARVDLDASTSLAVDCQINGDRAEASNPGPASQPSRELGAEVSASTLQQGKGGDGSNYGLGASAFCTQDEMQGPADFLGAGLATSSEAAAKIFNADGFFAKLQTLLDRSQQHAPGQPGVSTGLPGGWNSPIPDLPPFPEWRGQRGAEATIFAPSLNLQAIERAAPVPGAHPGPVAANRLYQGATATAPQTPSGQLAQPVQTYPSPSSREAALLARQAFRVWLDGGRIHVVGPLGALSGEDEAELMERLADLISEQGPTLMSLSINGRAFALQMAGK